MCSLVIVEADDDGAVRIGTLTSAIVQVVLVVSLDRTLSGRSAAVAELDPVAAAAAAGDTTPTAAIRPTTMLRRRRREPHTIPAPSALGPTRLAESQPVNGGGFGTQIAM